MNQKQNELINTFLLEIPSDKKSLFKELIEFVTLLGYSPKKTKTSLFGIDFRSAKLGQTIMKIEVGKPDKENPAIIGNPNLRLRFFATKEYSIVFDESIKKVIEAFDFKYTGCYGCGKCDGNDGYYIVYDNGKNYFRCGGELIPILRYDESYIDEIKQLLKIQHDYYVTKANKSS